MEQQQIISGNRIIAEFMGGKFFTDTPTILEAHIVSPSGGAVKCIDKLKYHSSWDWLMPVVEKICATIIEGVRPFNSDQYVRIEIVPSGYVKIENLRDTPIFTNVSIEGSLIKATWKAVVKFIQWLINRETNDIQSRN